MYYWPIYHFYVETRSLKKFISVNKLLFARHYHLVRPGFSLTRFAQYYVRPPKSSRKNGIKVLHNWKRSKTETILM